MNHGIDEVNTLTSLVLIAVLAFAVPLVTARVRTVRVPNVVGEIVAGMAVGGVGLNWVQETEAVTFLSDFGFAYLMFLSGLEIDFGMLPGAIGRAAARNGNRNGNSNDNGNGVNRSAPQSGLGLPLMTFGLTLGLAYVVANLLAAWGVVQSALMMTLILSTTSLGVVTPVLKERGLRSVFSQRVLLAAVIADFATMVLISVLAAALSGGSSAELLLILVLFAAFFSVYRIANRLLSWNWQLVADLEHATSQIGVRASFMLILVFVALAVSVGSELILGAFLAGAIVSLISGPESTTLRTKLDAIGYGFFIPIFFIMVGVRFDGGAILASPSAMLLIPVLLVALYAVKMVPTLLFRRVHTWRETVAAGLLLSSRLSLIIAASEIGLSLGVISPSVNAAIILLAIVTSSLSPVLFERAAPPAARASSASGDAPGGAPGEAAPVPGGGGGGSEGAEASITTTR